MDINEKIHPKTRSLLDKQGVTYGQWRDALAQTEEENKRLRDALETCVEFIEEAHIVEAQWHWEPIKEAKIALANAGGEAEDLLTELKRLREENGRMREEIASLNLHG